MVIKFCAVPPTTIEFSQRGKLVMSIEGTLKEIYGLLNEMDQRGEL
jgi:hypothetical protein